MALFVARPAWAGDELQLETSTLRVGWDAGSGKLTTLADKATGRAWLAPTVQAGFALQLVDVPQPLRPGDATRAQARRDADAVVIEYQYEKPVPLTVTCRYWPEPGAPSVLGRIAVNAKQPVRIAEMRFPIVPLKLPFAGTGEHDQVLWPECDGTLLRNPSQNRADRQFPYPGTASLQMLAAFDPAAGLMLAARDTAGFTKSFCTRRDKNCLELSIAHYANQTATAEWDLGYDVTLAGLGKAGGPITWESAADLYRQWAVRQPWCRQTTVQRVQSGDIPKWLIEPTLVVTFALRGQMPDGKLGNRLPLLVEQVNRWGKLVDAPVTSLVMAWEKLDSWVTPDYFPPYGGEAEFTGAMRQLHRDGHHSMVFLSGLHWTLHKSLAGPDRPSVEIDQEAEFNRRGRPWAISDAKGETLVSGKPDAGVGQTATICAGTALARAMLVGTGLRCQQMGIDCVQIDQIVGGGMKACLHPEHGHPAGGNWCSQALYRIFEELRRSGKARDPKFAFSIEEPCEFYLPLLDTYHARDLHQGRWPRSGAGVLGVPLFTHVYHAYAAGYGSEGCYVSEKPSKLAMYQLGMNLVCGKVPAVALWGRWCEPEKLDPPQQRLLRAHLSLWRGAAAPFLTYGERVALPPLDAPDVELTFMEKDGKTRRPLNVLAVLAGGWRLADGRTATILACIAEKTVEFRFAGQQRRLAPGEAVLVPGP